MKELIILVVGIIVFAVLIVKKSNKELFQNPEQVVIDDVEQLIFYTRSTLPDGVKDDLKNIIATILTDLNNMSSAKYYPGQYESVTLERGRNGDKRYIIDMTMFDIADRYNVRLLIDVVDKDNKYHLNNIRMVNADNDVEPIMSEIYGINTSKIIDSRLFTVCPNSATGSSSTSLESSILDKDNTHTEINDNPGGIRNKWVVDENMSKDCDKKTVEYSALCNWDKYGIQKEHTAKSYMTWPSYNPTITGLPHHTSDMNSMFNLARGIVDFPHSSA